MKYIKSKDLYFRITSLNEHVKEPFTFKEQHQGAVLVSDISFMIAKKKTLFRPLGILDWAYYTPKTLAEAFDLGQVEEYYYEMLQDPRSPTNEWKDKEKEKRMKAYYFNRDADEAHIGCFSYPECESSPNGCVVRHGTGAEPYGHRD